MPITFSNSIESAVTQGMNAYIASLTNAIVGIANDFAPQIEQWMKENAVWEDRTGDARRLLKAEVTAFTTGATIAFGYGAETFYGKYLEFSNAGRFAVLGPALDYWSPKVWQAVKELNTGGLTQINVEALPYGATYARDFLQT